MSRHRNIRNRAYSYDDDDYYDDYYDDEEYHDDANEYVYRRNSPTRQNNIFSFVEQPKENTSTDDQDLLQPRLQQVYDVLGSGFNEAEIVEKLRSTNYDVEKSIEQLLESHVPPTVASIQASTAIPNLDKASLTELKKKTPVTIEMPKPKAKQAAVVIGTTDATARGTTSGAAAPREKKKPLPKTEKSSDTSGTCSAVEKASFEKAEARAVAECEKMNAGQKERVSMVVIGHVDAGKSTIMGHLLYRLGHVSKRMMHKYEKESRDVGKSSFAFAWVMDADEQERNRGVTMDVGISFFETKSKHVTLLDAPGHKDFIPKMITGASQADVAMLVVPASTGEFEAAFENSGQTKEHTLLVRSLGVSQMIVAVNKMDSIDWDEERFNYIQESLSSFLQKSGFKLKNLFFVPVSGLVGANLNAKDEENKQLNAWYSGPSLIDAIDQFSAPVRPVSKPFRMGVSDIFKSMSLGQAISGRIYSGAIAAGDKVLIMPLGQRLTIKSIERDSKSVKAAQAGDNVDIGVTGIDPDVLTCGSLLCSIASPIKLVRHFRAQIMTMPTVIVPILKGSRLTFHIHNIDEPINVVKLGPLLSKSGDILSKKPRCVTRDMQCVVELRTRRPICLDRFEDFRQLGRFTLRERGVTLAAGIVTDLLL